MKFIYICLLLFIPFTIFSQSFNVPDFDNNKIGTYIPVLFIEELEKTNNYLQAMLINNDRYYDIISINKNIVYSNLLFHDQYAISPDIVTLFIFNENNGIMELIDQNGFKYIKISENINYSRVFQLYVNNIFINILNRFNQNIIQCTENGFIFNNGNWTLNINARLYPRNNCNFIFYNNTNREYIGIHYFRNELIIYKLIPDDDNFLAYKNNEIVIIIR